MNILFWNTYKNNHKSGIDDCLIELVIDKRCDIIILAEYHDDVRYLCRQINNISNVEYVPIPNNGGCEKIKGFINKKYRIENINEQHRYQIIKIETVSYKLLIGMIHNISKLHASDDQQKENLRFFNHDVCEAEKSNKTKNTLIIGDFNANPFEVSCVSADTIHAIPYIQEVKKKSRTVQGREYEKFYNPMWKFLGMREIPYATYYYNNSGLINYFYNIFDQIIIRPQLLNSFVDESLAIITNTLKHNLLTGHKPNKEYYSDHLPIFCTIKEENIK